MKRLLLSLTTAAALCGCAGTPNVSWSFSASYNTDLMAVGQSVHRQGK